MSVTMLDGAIDSNALSNAKLPFLSSPPSTSFPDPRAMPSSSSHSTYHEYGTRTVVMDTKGKGKERDFSAVASVDSITTSANDAVERTSTERPAPSSPAKRTRGSLLIVASDALGIRFGKRRKSIRQPLPPIPMPIILPGVMEISAPRPDAEEEERQQLRDAAAQAIGLTSSLLQPDVPAVVDEPSPVYPEPEQPPEEPTPISPPFSVTNFRPRSITIHSRTNSVAPIPIPAFPSSPAALSQFIQASATLPKYYTPSSLRIFALSRQWKHRHLMLTQPIGFVTTNSTPAVSYLHLFKTSGGEEKELERLEINEHSVVFVAEEEVSGRRQVVKVGGTDVGALKKEFNHEEGGRTMWFLQIRDQNEAQKWITIIKQSIFGQKAARAGLGSQGSFIPGVEPRGDMDVMLSMRVQGIVNSPVDKHRSQDLHSSSSRPGSSGQDPTASSSSSTRSVRTTTPRTAPAGAVSTLKGLFASTRPRSSSRSTSAECDVQTLGSTPPNPPMPIAQFEPARAEDLDQKIITDEELAATPRFTHPFSPNTSWDRANRALSMGAMPLQPPPRKRWTATTDISMYQHLNGNQSDTGVVQDREPSEELPNPLASGHLFGTPEQKPREPSILSVSTIGSADRTSTTSTRRSSSVKRWSRQLPLPKRLTPPNGPPPDIPVNQSPPRGKLHPNDGGSPSRDSASIRSARSGKSYVSTLPSFSKRTSVSSVMSVSTTSTSHSIAPSQNSSILLHARPGSSHRTSMPPPQRPAPTSALPPAPVDDTESFRKSAARRSFRLSLKAPKPPPTMSPPPAPNDYRSRRSSANVAVKNYLAPIPSSPNPSMSPLRPPSSAPSTTFAPPPVDAAKQRLRILSAPSPTTNPMPFLTPTPPLTPSDKFNYDQSSYLQLYTPITPTTPKIYVPTTTVGDDEPVLRSLSPPPRRMSKQAAERDRDRDREYRERAVPDPQNVPLPNTPRGSVVSLGLFTM